MLLEQAVQVAEEKKLLSSTSCQALLHVFMFLSVADNPFVSLCLPLAGESTEQTGDAPFVGKSKKRGRRK